MKPEDVMRVLSPLFPISAAVTDWNFKSQTHLAQRIEPHDVGNLTVRELLTLIDEVSA